MGELIGEEKILENLTKVKVDIEEFVRLQKLAKERIIDVIRKGIEDRFTIEILYDKEWRVINPHIYFVKNKTSNPLWKNDYVNAWQIEGFSKSGKLNSWKLYKVSKITFASILNPVREFKIEKSFKQDSKIYGNVFKHSVYYSCNYRNVTS